MDELDKKLVLAVVSAYARGLEGERKGFKEAVDKSVDDIKQAFNEGNYMTGQEWYDRFRKELKDKTDFYQLQEEYTKLFDGMDIIEAAKKASGVSDDNM